MRLSLSTFMPRLGPSLGLGLAFCLAPVLAPAAWAQDLFSPAIIVNERAISRYEIEQRRALLDVFGTQGDLDELAQEQLIEERLKSQAIAAAGLRMTEEGGLRAMEEFAQRTELSLDEFLAVIAEQGVERETLRDYVVIGTSWRDFVRAQFGSQVEVSESDIDAALARGPNPNEGVEVLLNEIIIAAPPERAAQVAAVAEEISQMRSISAFQDAARQVSALPSREQGGRLDWLPLSNYPAPLRPVILGLAPGEVTAPIAIPNGIALFQLRDVREAPFAAPAVTAIDYAQFYIAGGRSDAAVSEAAALQSRVDTCDDLYGEAMGLPPETLERVKLPPAEILQDVALELAKLDSNEVTTALTRSDGQTLVFLMLCGRDYEGTEALSRDAVRGQLISARLAGLADGLLADLRASATIIYANQ